MRRLRRCKFSRPPRSGAHSSICLPARASTCFVLLTPASAAYPGKWPITSRGGAPPDRHKRVSHESICSCRYAQPGGALKKALQACLRNGPRPTARATRWPRSRRQDRRGQIKSLLSIHVRPPKVHERQRPGHREGDLEGDRIEGARSTRAIGAWVGRATPWVLCWLSCCAPTRPQLRAASLRRQAAWPLQ